MTTAMVPDAIKADNAIVRPVWSILSKGKTGTGKTIASCGKEFRPTFVFNLEGRFESVLSYYRKLDGHVRDLEFMDYHISSGFYPLDQRMDAIVARPQYKTVVIASLTSYIHIVLKHLMASSNPKEGGRGLRKKGGIQVNILEDFNFEDAAIIYEMIGFLQELKSMGTNIILEAHISPYELVTLEEGQRVVTTINQILTKGKKAPAQIPGYFNEVWLFEKLFSNAEWGSSNQKAEYRINTLGTSADECKTSFGIPSFTWTDIDPTVKLMEFLNPDIKKEERVDPNAPKKLSW